MAFTEGVGEGPAQSGRGAGEVTQRVTLRQVWRARKGCQRDRGAALSPGKSPRKAGNAKSGTPVGLRAALCGACVCVCCGVTCGVCVSGRGGVCPRGAHVNRAHSARETGSVTFVGSRGLVASLN